MLITRFSTLGLLSAWSAFIGFLGVIAFLVVSQLGCDSIQFYGKRSQMSEVITYSNLSCNAHCGCSSSQYEPICSADGETVFFSPCQAGCTAVDEFTTINKYRRTAKREASRGGGSIQHKTICGRQICAPEEYSSLCGLSEGVRYRNH